MANYNDYNDNPRDAMRQKDLVLAPNEYVFLQNKTNGVIYTYTGPYTLTISQQEALVVFDEKTKQFKEVSNFDIAKQLFVSAPEGWYIVLKNPADKYPELGKAVTPELKVGKKINLRGPVTFSLYPGQMAKVVRGHALRTNQYLLARVYEAEAANTSTGEVLDAEGKAVEMKNNYVNGQILVIKGTEVSFYIPPTGIEVIAIENNVMNGYVREAETLERLEYCILKDEDGNKRYVHGPAVVFPKATETFVTSAHGSNIFRAIELSKISGIYVKVIAQYTDEKGKVHPIGEELFITGDDQMIYYPRPEHAIINYDEKIMHHAIAIPEGEGRYIMNRMTGEINTIRGPKMYLPDPRTEVVVRRKLTAGQCNLWYPGNQEALNYNLGLNEKSVEKSMRKGSLDELTAYVSSANYSSTLAQLESKANISRGTSYTKPRTITLDNKFDGVVSIDVWTGYAVNVVSKNGDRKTVCGPQTILLDYDQTLEILELSTGRPKTTDNTIKTVFLRHENNKVSDLITVETKDFVKATVKVSYCVDFDIKDMDKWFSVDNYVKYMTDRERALIKREAKNYTIEEFYQNYSDIVRNIVIDAKNETEHEGRYFPENGMYVHDVEVLDLKVDNEIEKLLLKHQHEIVAKTLELADAARAVEITKALATAEAEEQALRTKKLMNQMELQAKEAAYKMELQSNINRQKEAEAKAAENAKLDLQAVMDTISATEIMRKNAEHKAKLERQEAEYGQEENHKRVEADIEAAKAKVYADTVVQIMASVTPGLIEAMNSSAKSALLETVSKNISPYAIARGESVADVTNKLLRGTALEGLIGDVNLNV